MNHNIEEFDNIISKFSILKKIIFISGATNPSPKVIINTIPSKDDVNKIQVKVTIGMF
jgi:hypothetical protein